MVEVDDEDDVDPERLRFFEGDKSAGRESRNSIYSWS